MVNRFVILLLLMAVGICPAASQQPDSLVLFSDVSLPVIVLTANRTPDKLMELPAALSKVTPAPERRSTPEMLTATPGVFVQKTNHGGGSAFLRGLTGNQTLLLIDGIRLNNATFRYGPNQYLNTIDPFLIENMEVWKGGGSVEYGSDALGGTIQVLSREPAYATGNNPEWDGKALAIWRSRQQEYTGRLEGQYAGKRTGWIGGISYRDFGDLVGGDTTGRQSPSGYKEVAYDLKGKLKLSGNADLTVAHQFLRQQDVPVYHKIVLEDYAQNQVTRQQRQLSYARLEQRTDHLKSLQKITAHVSFQQFFEQRDIRKNGSPIHRDEQDEVNSLGVSLQADMTFLPGWSGTIGFESYHDLVKSNRTEADEVLQTKEEKRGLYPDGSTYTSAALFWLHHWDIRSWNFSGGLRYNYFSIQVRDEVLGKVHLTPGALVWNAAILRRLGPADRVFLDFNTGFRAPNIDDLGSLGIVDFRYEIPANDLSPEKSYNLELGWRHHSKKWEGQVFVFRNELRDLITRVRSQTDSIAGYPVYQKKNVQQGHIQGVEASSSVQITGNVRFGGAFSWQYGQNKTDEQPLRRIPPAFGRLYGQYKPVRPQSVRGDIFWHATLEWLFASRQDRLSDGDKSDNRIPEGGTPGWNVVNVYGSCTWKQTEWRVGCWNLFDTDYRYHGSGIHGMGRTISLTAIINFL